MSRAVLISIRPKWCELIASGKKTIEVRKTAPKIDTPFKCYIYCTSNGRPLVYGDKPCADGWTEAYTQTYGYSREEADKIWGVMNGKVIGEFVCKMIDSYEQLVSPNYMLFYYKVSPGGYFLYPVDDDQTQISDEELIAYGGGARLYGWHISELVIYDKPKELSEFKRWNRSEENSPCAHTKWLYEPCETCSECNLKRPPLSYCYVEETRRDNNG